MYPPAMPYRDVVGHTRLVTLLARAVARKTLPPSLLLAGPSGVGKRRVAVATAAALNCLDPKPSEAPPRTDEHVGSASLGAVSFGPATTTPPRWKTRGGDPGSRGGENLTRLVEDSTVKFSSALEHDACGVCAACRRIERGVHPDVVVIEPGDSGAIKIEPIREVIDQAGYRPFEGRRRVVIVDEADAMVPQAQNALLKTLEEPPSASVFMLVSSMPDALLATVLSRCPRLRFAPLSVAEVVTVLTRDHKFAAADARAAADASDGSVGVALSTQSADVVEARETAAKVLRQLARGAKPESRIDAARILTPSKTLAPGVERAQLAVCLRAMSSLLRDLSMIASRIDTGAATANADLADELSVLSHAYDARRSERGFVAVDEALAALERNASPKVVADWLALEL